MREARHSLGTLFSDALKAGRNPKSRDDKIFVDGKVYGRIRGVHVYVSDRQHETNTSRNTGLAGATHMDLSAPEPEVLVHEGRPL